MKLISDQLGINPQSIVDFDLSFADANPAILTGLNEDFISSPRLDNLFSTFHGTTCLIQLYSLSLRCRILVNSSTSLLCSTTSRWVLILLRVRVQLF